jgi:hypothetical protein
MRGLHVYQIALDNRVRKRTAKSLRKFPKIPIFIASRSYFHCKLQLFSLQAAANCQEPIQKTLELLALAAEQRWAFIHFARTIDRSAHHCAACYRHTVPTARGAHVRP